MTNNGYSKKYEMNPKNRIAAIKIHGCKCTCCEFDFEKVYCFNSMRSAFIKNVSIIATRLYCVDGGC